MVIVLKYASDINQSFFDFDLKKEMFEERIIEFDQIEDAVEYITELITENKKDISWIRLEMERM